MEMIQIVVDRFINYRTITTRHALVTKLKSLEAIDQLTALSVFEKLNNDGDVAPLALAFAYADRPGVTDLAKSWLTVALQVLQNLYDLTPPRKQVSKDELLNHARKMNFDVTGDFIERGLYLARELAVLESCGASPGQHRKDSIPDIPWVVISERIVVVNPEHGTTT
jgi:hypothetical protein